MTNSQKYYLELVEGGHNKYYEAYRQGNTVIFHWGRIGTMGQRNGFEFDGEHSAEIYMARKLMEKLKEDYEQKQMNRMRI